MKKGEIWLVELYNAEGHEQKGNRPTIILSDTQANVVIIIPLTSNIQALRFPYTIEIKPTEKNKLNSLSIALLFQIRAIDKNRLINKIGDIEEKIIKDINLKLMSMLSL